MSNKYNISPLFLPIEDSRKMGNELIQFAKDDYNKAIGESLIDAQNDAQAISVFLSEYRDSHLTLNSYAKEIERLLLWCIHIAKVNISSLRRTHLLEYQAFLKDPQPSKAWCGSKAPRCLKDGSTNPKWRPFYKGLEQTSLSKAITILDAFFNYLVQTNYLIGNPLAAERKRKRKANKQLREYPKVRGALKIVA